MSEIHFVGKTLYEDLTETGSQYRSVGDFEQEQTLNKTTKRTIKKRDFLQFSVERFN